MKIVLFLGAGFSAPFGLPVMNTFIRQAQDSERLTVDDKTFINKLILDARAANSFLQTSPTNLEDILSISVMQDRLAIDTIISPRTPLIVEILQKIYTDPHEIDNYWNRFDILKHFIGEIFNDKSNSLSIITTNYDLVIESAFKQIRRPVSPILQYDQCPKTNKVQVHGQLYDSAGIPIYKLHGSVNWFIIEQKLCIESSIVEVYNSSSHSTLPLVCTSNYDRQHIPLIVPPSFLKTDLKSPIVQVWEKAAEALKDADQIVFVGYSFPQSDIEMKYFLSIALINNPRIRRIDIIDPNADNLVARLKTDKGGFGNHFIELLKPRSKDWTKATLELV